MLGTESTTLRLREYSQAVQIHQMGSLQMVIAKRDVQSITDRKPRDDEIDVYGLTHPGKLRAENQDHFLICSLHKSIAIHGSSLPDFSPLPAGSPDDRQLYAALRANPGCRLP